MKRILSCVLFLAMTMAMFCQQEGFVLINGGKYLGANRSPQIIDDLLWSRRLTTVQDWDVYIEECYKDFKYDKLLDPVYSIASISNLDKKWPIMGVTWLEAANYCNWLSRKEGKKEVYTISKDIKYKYVYDEDDINNWPHVDIDVNANGYRMPTTDEWEWAAKGGRAGIQSNWYRSAKLTNYGYFCENSNFEPQKVSQLLPNPCGLFDMVGLAMEWTSSAPDAMRGFLKTVKGACFLNSYNTLPDIEKDGTTTPQSGKPDYYNVAVPWNEWDRNEIGFRLVCRVAESTK